MITFSRLGRYGQIGNQMFQIAGTMGIAARQSDTAAFPAWINHDGVAKGNMDEADAYLEPWFAHALPRIDAYTLGKCQLTEVPWGYHPRLRVPSNADLIGHMQSEHWFMHIESAVREQFTFKHAPPKVAKCAIHVRGGDYDGAYHNRLTEKYYHESMQIMYKRGHTAFTVFSDDPSYAQSVTGMDSIDIPDPMNAMRMMSGYEANIIANSSFSWWSAWLSGNTDVVAPTQWVGPAARLDTNDIIPDRWVKVAP